MPAPYPDIDGDERVPSLLVDSRIDETSSGEKRCIIFDRVLGGDANTDRWIAADEGWFVDLRETR
jgi:hypothetical protein